MIVDFRKLQSEMNDWQERNFSNTTIEPLLGVVEEVGELTHAVLKSRQKIRGFNETELKYKIRDAIGDIVIYLINFCNKMDIDFVSVVEETWAQVKDRDWVKFPKNGKTE